MPLFGNREKPSFSPRPSPASPRPSFGGGFKENLFGSRPAPKPEQKSQAKPELKKLFGEKQYKTFLELRQFARKAPYEPMPGTGRKIGQKERLKLIQELQERGKKMGQTYGLSKEKLNAVLGKMKKEKMYTKDFKQKKLLDQKIKQYERWAKGS